MSIVDWDHWTNNRGDWFGSRGNGPAIRPAGARSLPGAFSPWDNVSTHVIFHNTHAAQRADELREDSFVRPPGESRNIGRRYPGIEIPGYVRAPSGRVLSSALDLSQRPSRSGRIVSIASRLDQRPTSAGRIASIASENSQRLARSGRIVARSDRAIAVLLIGACATASLAFAGGGGPAPFTEEAVARGVDYFTPQRLGLLGFGYGVAFADLDNDGDPDFVACGSATGLIGLWENDGAGVFTNRAATAGAPLTPEASGLIAFDYDADGDLDLYITQVGVGNVLLRNDGGFAFTDVSATAGVADTGPGMGPAAGDYDGDGYLDIYVTNYDTIDRVYHNNGDGTFDEVAGSLGLADPWRGYQAVFFDYDRDGDADLYVSNDKKSPIETVMHNRLYENSNGVLIDVSIGSGADINIYSMGVAVGDFNGDGLPDMYCTNLAHEPNALLINLGSGQFVRSEVTAQVESYRIGWGAAFLDYDNDRHCDLYVCNSFAANRLYAHGGSWPCVDIGPSVGVDSSKQSYSMALADVDDDGDMDIAVQNNDERLELFINHEGSSRHWAKVRVIGEAPNHFAVGATVAVRVGSQWDYREVYAGGNGFKGANDLTLHFGLDAADAIDEMEITWPGGATRTMTNIAADQTWHIYPPARLGDSNADGDVTLIDYADLAECVADPSQWPTSCNVFDLDGNGAINLTDYAGFQIAVGG